MFSFPLTGRWSKPALNPSPTIRTGQKFSSRRHFPSWDWCGTCAVLTSDPVFVVFMGLSESRTIPFSYWTEIFPYCFDCWPNEYERWASFFKRHRVRLAFFSARQSAQHFAAELPGMQAVWLPEATNPLDYSASKSLADRDIDVLELGRKYDQFHFKIVDSLAAAGRRHLFEKVKGKIIFPDRATPD